MFLADFLIMTGKTNIKLEEDNGSQIFCLHLFRIHLYNYVNNTRHAPVNPNNYG